MKDESGMTKDIEQVAKEFASIYHGVTKHSPDVVWLTLGKIDREKFISFAKYIQRQVRIAEIKARIEIYDVYCCSVNKAVSFHAKEFKSIYEAQLAEAEKGDLCK